MKIFLIWTLILYIIQVTALIVLAYFNPNKPNTVSELVEELKSIHWAVWIPYVGLITIILAVLFTACVGLWEKFSSLKIRR